MQLGSVAKTGMALGAMLLVAALGACASGGSSGGTYKTFMQKCEEAATTEMERSECAWKNAERNASGK